MIFNNGIVDDVFNKLVSRNFVDVRDWKLSKIITKPITVNPNTTLMKIREILLKNKIKRVIIVDKNKPIGIISEKDIAKKIYGLGTTPIKFVKAKDFKTRTLFTLTRNNSVQECAKMILRHKISLIIILNKDKTLEGIVTKTNIVTALLTKESKPIKVSKIMKNKVITADPNDPILQIENLLIKYRISRIVIERNKKPVGIITFRDFVPAKIPQWIAESADPKEIQEYKFRKGLEETHSNQMSYLLPFHATDIMTTKPITVEANEDVKIAITQMIKYNISGLPVIKNTKLVGIITKSDIVNTLAS